MLHRPFRLIAAKDGRHKKTAKMMDVTSAAPLKTA